MNIRQDQKLWSVSFLTRKKIMSDSDKISLGKVSDWFKGNILAAGLVEMELLYYFNGGAEHLLCVIDVFTKYAIVHPLMNKKAEIVLDYFMRIRPDFFKVQTNCLVQAMLRWKKIISVRS